MEILRRVIQVIFQGQKDIKKSFFEIEYRRNNKENQGENNDYFHLTRNSFHSDTLFLDISWQLQKEHINNYVKKEPKLYQHKNTQQTRYKLESIYFSFRLIVKKREKKKRHNSYQITNNDKTIKTKFITNRSYFVRSKYFFHCHPKEYKVYTYNVISIHSIHTCIQHTK